jgi:AcrR family transcriptional regulator
VPRKKQYHHGDLRNALIQAGIDILAKEGVSGLSLRKAARKAGVSHAAPYGHFADKQALVAAIATEGYRKLYDRLSIVGERYAGDPLRQLIEGAWAYAEFAIEDPAHFRVTLSGTVEKEADYPALVEATERSFGLVLQIVSDCQAAGVLRPAPADLMAVSIWGTVHGLVALVLDGQISHKVLERFSVRQMLLHSLGQFCLVQLPVTS